MKYIRKGGPPHDYNAWCKRVKGTVEEDYRCLQNPAKRNLLRRLLDEQGWLCAYTMKRIYAGNSHIEHIKPESICRDEKPGSDLDYGNLVACFPQEGMPRRYRYGAQEKGDWWEDGRGFISPLHEACERRFRFDLEGNIDAVSDQHAAVNTIRILGLQHETLIEDRRRVIREFVFGEDESGLSLEEADRALVEICNRKHDGKFLEFCVAVRDGILDHIKRIQKLARKRKYSGKKRR